MKTRFQIILAIVALTIAGCAGVTPANTPGVPAPNRTITVVGEGSASAKPDVAHTTIGVQVTAPTAADAAKQNSDKMNAVIAKLKSLGLADKDIQTSNYDMTPIHNTGKGPTNDIVGYQVSNNVSITIRDLDKVGTILDQVTQAGANNIYGITFAVDDTSKMQSDARAKAMADAQKRADELARLAGATRGDVLVVSEVIQSNPVPLFAAPAAVSARAADAAPSIEAGDLSLSMRVQVIYSIK